MSSAPPSIANAMSTNMPAQRFSCAYEDGASDMYYETIKDKRVLFRCLMGTKCYQRPNQYSEIRCIYPGGAEQSAVVASPTVSHSPASQAANMFSVNNNSARFASAMYAQTQFAERAASSDPQVLSVKVVLPTIALKITNDSGPSDVATVISIGAAASTLTELKVAPLVDGIYGDSADMPSAPSVDAGDKPVSSVVQFNAPTPTQPMGIPDEFPSVSAQGRRIITIDDNDLFSVLYTKATRVPATKAVSTPSTPVMLAPLSPPPSKSTTPTFTGSSPPSSTAPAFTGSSPPSAAPLPSLRHKGKATVSIAELPETSLATLEQNLQAQDPAVSVLSPVMPELLASSAPALALPLLPTSTSNADIINIRPLARPTVTLPPASALTLNPMAGSMPLPTNQPEALTLPALQEMPGPVVAPIITVVLHPSFAPVPIATIVPSAAPTPMPMLMTASLPPPAPVQMPVTAPLLPPAFSSFRPQISPLLPPLPKQAGVIHNLDSHRDIWLADSPANSALDPVYPQNTPIIPFISNGIRQPTPTDGVSEEAKNDAINANGIADILQNIFHVPPEMITIGGRPVSVNDLGKLGSDESVNVVVMDPNDPNKGSGQDKGIKGMPADDDDDLLNDIDDDADAGSMTHSLNVDRAKHRNHALAYAHARASAYAHAHVHAHQRVEGSKLPGSNVGTNDDANSDSDSNSDSDDDDSGSDSDSDSDSETDDGDKNVPDATPTSSTSTDLDKEIE
ncbi:hypothetical protein GGF43_000953 [Coemansia sp. RSA 2618]|nr:hypothetical protein GGF43_000953 [Coemansia sp. RSA 2618]